MFFVHLATYRRLYNDREDSIIGLGFESRVGSNQSGNFVAVEIKNDAMLLATFCWWINFKHGLNNFVQTYKAVLTVEGFCISSIFIVPSGSFAEMENGYDTKT